MTYGYYFRYFLIIAFLFIAAKSYRNTKKKFILKVNGFKQLASYLVTFSLACVFLTDLIFALKGTACPPFAIDLEFPLKNGQFCILHGGSNKIINPHYPVLAQRYALDIVQLNTLGSRTSKWNPKKLEDFKIFKTSVYSPCEGTIVEAQDGYQDLQPSKMDPKNPAGNYIAIAKKDSDIVIILAHLLKGSILIQEGDFIEKGQLLAKVGNSGNTSEPHLHIHSVSNKSGDILFTGKGVPMKFNSRYLVRNDRIN
ncbi:MAG: M23 family metallopeptidase [Simkaniaceae bacterium]|nr:M23 family metallopeptidase [Candidatus Sacchlamyda saccharinae]